MAEWSMAPRQMSGCPGLTRKPIDMTLTLKASAGISFSDVAGGSFSMPIIVGTLGP